RPSLPAALPICPSRATAHHHRAPRPIAAPRRAIRPVTAATSGPTPCARDRSGVPSAATGPPRQRTASRSAVPGLEHPALLLEVRGHGDEDVLAHRIRLLGRRHPLAH